MADEEKEAAQTPAETAVETAAPEKVEKKDEGGFSMPWWSWVLIGLGVLALAAGGGGGDSAAGGGGGGGGGSSGGSVIISW